MVEAGQKYRVIPAFAKTPTVKGNMQVGKVVYVHPQNRYAVLEFEGVEGNPRECFPLEELTKDNFAGYGKRKRV